MKSEDLTNRKFNMLTVLEKTDKRCSEGILWLCRCECDNICYASTKSLKNGNKKSCGCLKHKTKDITNKRFDRLVAIKPIKKNIKKGASTIWQCKCDCDNIVDVEIRLLQSGNTKSCGCLNKEIASKKANTVLHKIDGTMVELIKSKKIPKNNSSGIKGVSWSKQKQDWEANISFKGIHYHLGHYKNIEDAAAIRKEAEKEKFGEFLKWYEEKDNN